MSAGVTGKALDLITIGRASVDLYGHQVGGRLEDVASFDKYVGGCPTNIAIGGARLGLRTAVITRVGDDHMGRFIREELMRENVDVAGVTTDKHRLTALAILGIRSSTQFPLLFYREDCADMGLCEDDVDVDFVASAAAILVTGTHLSTPGVRAASLKAIQIARASGGRVVFDIDYRPVLWGLTGKDLGESRFVDSDIVTRSLQDIAPLCDMIVGTEEEFHVLGGDTDTLGALRAVRKISDAIIVCKTGAEGCVIFEGAIGTRLDSGMVVSGFPIEVFNVLGAGDAFMSGLLRGWLDGRPLGECGRLGNGAGAIVVSRHGCSPASPSWTELSSFLDCPPLTRRLREDRALEQLHWSTTRRRVSDHLNIMAFDHRSQFEQLAREVNADSSRISAFKTLAFRALDLVANGESRFGLLADGRFGIEALEHAADRPYWIGRPIELPGSYPVKFEASPDVATEIATWPLNHVVKCLVFTRRDTTAAEVESQERQLLRLFDACRKTRHELLLEIIAVGDDAFRDEIVSRQMERYYNLGIFPDWWKLEPGADSAYWDKIADVIGRHDPYCRGVLLLGLAMPLDRLVQLFGNAANHPIVKGFAVGRSITNEAARKWLAGAIDDDTAIGMIGANLRILIDGWAATRGGVERTLAPHTTVAGE